MQHELFRVVEHADTVEFQRPGTYRPVCSTSMAPRSLEPTPRLVLRAGEHQAHSHELSIRGPQTMEIHMSFATLVSHNDLARPTAAAGSAPGATTAVKRLFSALQAKIADRSLRSSLATMDDAMLRDIGIADDEIHRIRQQQNFTPRAWC